MPAVIVLIKLRRIKDSVWVVELSDCNKTKYVMVAGLNTWKHTSCCFRAYLLSVTALVGMPSLLDITKLTAFTYWNQG